MNIILTKPTTLLVVVAVLCFISQASTTQDESSSSDDDDTQEAKIDPDELKTLYRSLLIKKRNAQHDAVKKILSFNDRNKENEMVTLLVKKLFETLSKSLENLAKLHSESNKPGFTIDEKTTNDVSMIIENTAFGADLALHFPNIFHKLYDNNQNWHLILQSSIAIAIKSGLPDDETLKAINLMSQELGIIEKEPGFSNPFSRRRANTDEDVPTSDEKANKKEKKKRQRGPGLSNSPRNEL